MHWLKQTLIYSPFGFYQDHTFQLLLNLEQMIDTINLSGKCLLRSWCHRCLLYNQISFWNQSCCHLLADLRQSCSFTFLEAALISNTVFSGQMCIFNCKFLYQTQFYTSSAIMTKKKVSNLQRNANLWWFALTEFPFESVSYTHSTVE